MSKEVSGRNEMKPIPIQIWPPENFRPEIRKGYRKYKKASPSLSTLYFVPCHILTKHVFTITPEKSFLVV